ncbi:MAG: NAD(P)-dependent oxidoreductase [Bacteroidota bacterium]|nr:NAD(P)-dependent oxidoreductase [Bacteroidota bacterium]
MKTILVTGATGFIGSYVIDGLLQMGYNVIASSAHTEKAIGKSWFNKVIYKPFNLSSFDNSVNCFEYFMKPDLLIHLAWAGLPNYKNDFHVAENLPANIQFLKNLLDNGLTDISVAGTCLEYGMKGGCLSEEMKCDPANAYAVAKNELRKWLENYALEKNFNFKWIRLFYIFGKGQNPNSLFSQLENAIFKEEEVFNMSAGEQVRDYLPIESVAKYIIEISLQNKTTGIINCCSGAPVKIIDLVEKFIKKSRSPIQLNKGYYPYPDYEPMAFWGNNSKLKKIINDERSDKRI